MAVMVLIATAGPLAQQQTVSDALSFLLTNRSIPTDDFIQDEQAAAATRDTISDLLLVELSTLPTGTSAGGFTYRLEPTLGTMVLSSDSFGPFFVERSLTGGQRQLSFGLSYQRASYHEIDGRNLRDGTMIATASRARGEADAFDVETLVLQLETDRVTVVGNVGVTDRFDLSAAIPLVRLTLSGQRTDNYRGREVIQATASATASGLGDVVVRAKYNVLRRGGSGVALGSEIRLPTGSKQNLLGAGRADIQPRVIASLEHDRIALHGNLGYSVRNPSNELDYGGAIAVAGIPRLTLVGEVLGRRLGSSGRLTETIAPHPSLVGIDTVRLTSAPQATNRVIAMAGLKWNVVGTLLLTANVMRPLTDSGLNARWVPTVTFDYSFER
jgi:hypothetical protein